MTHILFPVMTCSGVHGPTPVTADVGLLASLNAWESGCGSTASPWLIEAESGLRINLTMLDFGSSETHRQSKTASCIQYGFISERQLGVNKTICGGNRRQEVIYTSATSSVEIMLAPSGQNPPYFLVKYQGKILHIGVARYLVIYFSLSVLYFDCYTRKEEGSHINLNC